MPSSSSSPSTSSSSHSRTVRFLHRYLHHSVSPSLIVLHVQAKSWLYFGLTTALLFLCLSNSMTRLLQTLWADCGDHWAVVWSAVLRLQLSQAALYIAGSSLLHVLTYWSYALILACFDLSSLPHALSPYKIQPAKNVPVDGRRLRRCVQQVLVNQLLVAFPLNALTYPLAVWRGVGFGLPLPSFETFCWHMAAFLLVEEAAFYYAHRLLHHPRLYGRIHKQHHEWTAPVAMAAIYCHPVEHLLSNLLPAMAGPLLCSSHLSTIWVWQFIATVTSVNTHSGYHLPFMPSPEAHDFHHLRFNVNYGVVGLLDWLHGTDAAFRQSDQYEHHKTFFTVGEYQPGRAWLLQRLARGGAAAGSGGRQDEKDGREEDVKTEQQLPGLGSDAVNKCEEQKKRVDDGAEEEKEGSRVGLMSGTGASEL